jgi:hypothetical protein
MKEGSGFPPQPGGGIGVVTINTTPDTHANKFII